jgi:nitrogen fixation protein FixH
MQSKVFEETTEYQVNGEELSINKLQLNFDVPINDIDKKDVKLKNIGNSAVYVQFCFKNAQKINSNGFKDTKSKFYCHYENTVIKPGEEVTFIFSFISEFPGNFTE